MDDDRRYPEEPDSRWYSGQSSYDGKSPYESEAHERPDYAYRLPEPRDGDEPRRPLTGGVASLAPSGSYPDPYRPDDPITTGGFSRSASHATRDDDADPAPPRTALDAIRVPLRPTEYPAVRPTPATSPADTGTSLAAPPLSPVPPTAPTSQPIAAPAGGAVGGSGSGAFSAMTSAYSDPAKSTYAAAATSGYDAPATSAYADPAKSAYADPAKSAYADPPKSAYNEPTSFVPPVGVRTADGPGAERFVADRDGAARGAGGRLGGDTVYRTRRPASAVIFAVVTALLMVPVVRLLVQASFVDDPAARGIVPAVLMTLGLPLTGFGLYGVAGAGGAMDRSALARPPAGYLLVGLVLLVAAGLATA